jgi:hypothetical protein
MLQTQTITASKKFDINGNFVMSWGTKGSGDGQFIVPVSVEIDVMGTSL